MMILFPADGLMLAFWSPGPAEMLVLAVVALLLYGGNLPEVARSWGKSFAEFRRGLTGFQNELNEVIYSEPEQLPYHDESEYPPRDDSRLAHGYEDPEDFHDDHYQPDGDDAESYESAGYEPASARPDEFSPSDPPANETASSDDVEPELDENDQTVKDASADTVVIEPEKRSE